MNKFKNYVGIDISKDYFDVVFIQDLKSKSIHNQFENTVMGVRKLLTWLKSLECTNTDTLLCMEHTGMYSKIIITSGTPVMILNHLRFVFSTKINESKVTLLSFL